MIRPLFARGKAGGGVLSQPHAALDNRLFTGDASSRFAVGDWLFIAEADGSGLEFLGSAVAVDAISVTAAHSLKADKSAAATVWRAASAFLWPMPPALPLKRAFASGVTVAQSVGGAVHSARIGTPNRVDSLKFNALPVDDFEVFRAWVDGSLHGGLWDFTDVDERGIPAQARLLTPDWKPVQPDEQFLTLELDVMRIAENVYV